MHQNGGNETLIQESKYHKLRKYNISPNALVLLLELIENVNSTSEFDDLLVVIGSATKKLADVEATSVMLLDEESNELRIVESTGPVADEIKGKLINAQRGYAGKVVETGKPLFANNVQNDDEVFDGELSDEFTTYNLICVPLHNKHGELIGVLEAINRPSSSPFNEKDIPVMSVFADNAARVLEHYNSLQKMKEVINEREIMLREIHHRVKNDFALVSGLVEMSSYEIDDDEARTILKNVQSRIKAMADVHEMLTNKDPNANVDTQQYFQRLLEKIVGNLSTKDQQISLETDIEEFKLHSVKALSCGLVLNELLMNSFKHGFSDDVEGTITLNLQKNNGVITLIYADNGRGLSADFDLQKQTSMGSNILKALVRQLQGKISVESEGTTKYEIKFPIQPTN